MTIEQYSYMVEAQQGRCAICKKEYKRFHIDHNHDTGNIRELLCSNCNTALGLLKEYIMLMSSAIDYIEKHRLDKVGSPS